MQPAEIANVLLRKAEHDQYAMNFLLGDPLVPDEVVGFHAQQAVEKSIKAVLAHREIAYRRTHQLDELVVILHDSGISFPPELSEAEVLTPFAVDLRYDVLPVHDDAAAPFDRQWAKRCVEHIVQWAAAVVEERQG